MFKFYQCLFIFGVTRFLSRIEPGTSRARAIACVNQVTLVLSCEVIFVFLDRLLRRRNVWVSSCCQVGHLSTDSKGVEV